MNNKDNKGVAQRERDDELLTIAEVADIVRVPVATLRCWRQPAKRRAQPGALDLLEVEPANPKTEKEIHAGPHIYYLHCWASATVPKSIIR